MVEHATTYSHPVIVEVSIQFNHVIDVSSSVSEPNDASKHGLPDASTNAIWAKLVPLLSGQQHVIFGVCNEPFHNANSIPSAFVAMQSAVQYIRGLEAASGNTHIISVSGLDGWAADVGYYVNNRIALSSGGQDLNVVYESHCYGCNLNNQILLPFVEGNLPMIIGEIGPANFDDSNSVLANNAVNLMQQADAYGIPFAWWSFAWDCTPSGVLAPPQNACSGNMALTASAPWGQAVLSFAESSSW